jgi:DNA repair photolyase
MFKSWEKVNIINDAGEQVEASAPVIISASRSTDIPAFYSKWFIERLKKGYLVWRNPFNNQKTYITFANTRLFVFWSKNPKPLMKYLPELNKRKINYYFQFTLNDYERENFEPKVPPLEKRIETFKKLSKKIGKEKVIWRFDPLILTDEIDENNLLRKIEKIGNEIYNFTEKLVFSYADINVYRKVKTNLKREGIEYIEFNKDSMNKIAEGIASLNKKWGLELATCCEEINLDEFGIKHNKCIDDELIYKLFNKDKLLMDFLGYEETEQGDLFSAENNVKRPNLKDKGQRKICGCIVSKDIGEYDTCSHLCVYCYANSSVEKVKSNQKKHTSLSESLV